MDQEYVSGLVRKDSIGAKRSHLSWRNLRTISKIRYVKVSCSCNLAIDDEMSNICKENELGFHVIW